MDGPEEIAGSIPAAQTLRGKEKALGFVRQDQDAARWKARVSVELTPVNKYGDELDASTLEYIAVLSGSLVDIVTRLERLKEAAS